MTAVEFYTARLRLALRRHLLDWLLSTDEKAAIALYASSISNQPGRKGAKAKPFDENAAVTRMLKGTPLDDTDTSNPLLWRSEREQEEYEYVREKLDSGNAGYASLPEDSRIVAFGQTFSDRTELKRYQAKRMFEMRQDGCSRAAIARELHLTVPEVVEDEERYLGTE